MTDAMLSGIGGKLFIDGKFIEGRGGRIDVENPARGEIIGQIAAAAPEEIEWAVTGARRAFRSWSRVPAKVRSQALHKLGDLIAADARRMAQVMTLEQASR